MEADISNNYCYRHKNKETRISCTECGRYICFECITQLPVGQKCPDCIKNKVTHLEKISLKQYFMATITSVIVACIIGYIYHQSSIWGIIYQAIYAFIAGFIVSKSICMTIGYKIGFRIQLIAVISIFIGFYIDPITLYLDITAFGSQINPVNLLISRFQYPDFTDILVILISSWSSIRSLRL